MKKFLISTIFIAGLIAAASFLGCTTGVITGSENQTTKEFNLSDFSRVEAGYAFEITVIQSDSYSVSVTADDNLVDFVQVSQTGDTLRVGFKPGYSYHPRILKALITMPNLYELSLSGGSHGVISGFYSSEDFELNLSGASIATGGITADNVTFSLSGASKVDLTGSANNIDITASGSSQLLLDKFEVVNADVNLSGGSEATVMVGGTLEGNLSGGSQLKYIGQPTIGSMDISGGSVLENIEPPRLSP